jgi:hypothetical protein
MTSTIRLSGPADVLTILPYQLGFHPHDCLVVVSLQGLHRSRVGLIQRIDLPPAEQVGGAVAALIRPLRQNRPKAVLLVGFEEREGESRLMLDEMAVASRAHGIEVSQRMVVRGGRWFDPDSALRCWPHEGTPLLAPSEVPAVAEFVGREIFPLPDRLALASLLEPKEPQSQVVSRLADEWLQLRAEATDPGATGLSSARAGLSAREAGRRSPERGLSAPGAGLRSPETGLSSPETDLTSPETGLYGFRGSEFAVWALVLCDEDDAQPIRELPPQDLAILAVSLSDVELRDALIAWLCPGTLAQDVIDPTLLIQMSSALPQPLWRGANAGGLADLGDLAEVARVIGRQRIERRLCELSAALPDAWAVSTLTMLASFTWWRGDGALTRIALDRALRLDPHYRLAQLLEQIVDLAIRPDQASA